MTLWVLLLGRSVNENNQTLWRWEMKITKEIKLKDPTKCEGCPFEIVGDDSDFNDNEMNMFSYILAAFCLLEIICIVKL